MGTNNEHHCGDIEHCLTANIGIRRDQLQALKDQKSHNVFVLTNAGRQNVHLIIADEGVHDVFSKLDFWDHRRVVEMWLDKFELISEPGGSECLHTCHINQYSSSVNLTRLVDADGCIVLLISRA